MNALLRTFLSMVLVTTHQGIARADNAEASPVGFWKTIDDKTGQAQSIVRIVEVDGELHGRIEKLLVLPKDNQDPVCKNCAGDKKNKPIRGLEILWGFKRESKGWSSGYVLSPKEGRTYQGNIEVIDNGKRLKLFGYVRVVVKIGRSQVWERVSSGN